MSWHIRADLIHRLHRNPHGHLDPTVLRFLLPYGSHRQNEHRFRLDPLTCFHSYKKIWSDRDLQHRSYFYSNLSYDSFVLYFYSFEIVTIIGTSKTQHFILIIGCRNNYLCVSEQFSVTSVDYYTTITFNIVFYTYTYNTVQNCRTTCFSIIA